MTEQIEFHPLADLFPPMMGEKFQSLVADIAANGLREPVVLLEGKILDGRNRYRACQEANVECRFKDWQPTSDSDTPLAYVLSLNLKRRHLDESQRAWVAAKLETLKQGRPAKEKDANLHVIIKRDEAAELINVSPRSVASAAEVRDHGSKELQQAVEDGEIAVSLAAKLAREDQDFQRAVVEKARSENVKPLEAARLVKAERIAERLIAEPSGKYRIIYADPPWRYGNSQPDTFGEQRDHYKTMPLAEIAVLPVKEWAEDNAVLFLWVTSPILYDAKAIIDAWGFAYKSQFVWDKVGHVMGHYNSVRHELLLICTRGSCQPDVRKLYDSVVSIEKTDKHSEKPTVFREIIDTLYPRGRRLEMFARGQAATGWDVYGLEAEKCRELL